MKERLTEINRSLTGDGVRESLKVLQGIADFQIKEIPSGTRVFDWTIPDEWNIRSARLEGKEGVIADLKDTNLRVMGYSTPIDKELKFKDIEPHLHTHRIQTAIPYKTSYYDRDWGFCLTGEEQRRMDRQGTFHAKIDSTLEKGSMTYGECIIPGRSGKEYLVTTYSCHPTMYNDNISGMIVWAKLLHEMQNTPHEHGYHFFIGPETIGVMSLLQRKLEERKCGKNGTFDGAIVINCVGRNEDFVLKKSYKGNSEIDRVAEQTLKEMDIRYTTVPFSVNGSDERQLQSPAFRIPTINITRGGYYGTDWYHNSRDTYKNKSSFLSLSDESLNISTELYKNLLDNLDRNKKIYSLNPHCEPQLGKRGLYNTQGGSNEKDLTSTIAKWIMHKDGEPLVSVSEETGIPLKEVSEVADKLKGVKLIK